MTRFADALRPLNPVLTRSLAGLRRATPLLLVVLAVAIAACAPVPTDSAGNPLPTPTPTVGGGEILPSPRLRPAERP